MLSLPLRFTDHRQGESATKGADQLPYGKVRDVEYDCPECEDMNVVAAECLNCDGTGEIIISADGDIGVCGECGGDKVVFIPCPKCSNDHAAADAAEQLNRERADT